MQIGSGPPSYQLVSLGSEGIESSVGEPWRRFAEDFPDAEPLAPLYERKNGFVAFESAFICLPVDGNPICPGLYDLRTSPPWRDDPASPASDGLVFAANGIGETFLLKGREVRHVDLVSEAMLARWADVESFCGDLLSNYGLHTAYDLVRAWQAEHGPLPIGSILSPKIPFLLGGDYSVANLVQMPLLLAMQFNHDLGRQMRGLDEGDAVEVKVVP